ncbi:MAG: hypothetical protein LBM16_01775 [Clostridiales bacterium]|jgi:hypothetical protein|nr:hypothetical protein [Clostridiales bacterium]
MIDDNRATEITIGQEKYKLFLSTKAFMEISKRYGGIEQLGENFLSGKSIEETLSEVVWLVTLLANQSIIIHNLQHPNDKKELLTEGFVEAVTEPFELSYYKNALLATMTKGTKREVISEISDGKNLQGA